MKILLLITYPWDKHKLKHFWEISVPPFTVYATDTFKPQKGSKDIIKVIHVTPVVKPQFYEVMRVLRLSKKKLFTTLFTKY